MKAAPTGARAALARGPTSRALNGGVARADRPTGVRTEPSTLEPRTYDLHPKPYTLNP